MNKQYKNPDSRGISWTDYTWNPIGGCLHGCAWRMPDGSLANCYAEDVAGRLAQAAYPKGFEYHYWHPEALMEPLSVRQRSRIFVGSMADVFGRWVPDFQIEAILNVCAKAPWHQFQFLTKNAPRLLQFIFPANCWVGVSAPPSEMWGHPLTEAQQVRFLDRACEVLGQVKATVRWISFEPLSFDVAAHFTEQGPSIEWAVVGAASSGKTYYQPEPRWVKHLTTYLDDHQTAVFFKENLRGNMAADPWREEFPETRFEPVFGGK